MESGIAIFCLIEPKCQGSGIVRKYAAPNGINLTAFQGVDMSVFAGVGLDYVLLKLDRNKRYKYQQKRFESQNELAFNQKSPVRKSNSKKIQIGEN